MLIDVWGCFEVYAFAFQTELDAETSNAAALLRRV